MSAGVRLERDLLGERSLDDTSLHGLQTLRALENFPQFGHRVCDVPEFGRSFGAVKLAAVRANVVFGVLRAPLADALAGACEELAAGSPPLLEALTVPIIQGGAGTSTNMNVNEVLANRTLELLGRPPGDYGYCHPNDHVNRSQSTNDVYPTALRLALIARQRHVDAALRGLAERLASRAEAHHGLLKLGRTQLQDAVTIGAEDEIHGWADQCNHAADQLGRAVGELLQINLGGTAIGTGVGAPPGFAAAAVANLRKLTELELESPDRLVSATTDPTPLLGYSAALRSAAVDLAKLADDLRLLASGPATGLAEVDLPVVQAGSSMMPGKVNPVIPEFVNQLVFRVHGADTAATLALSAGQLQLNAMLPIVAHELFRAQEALWIAAATLRDRCVEALAFRPTRLDEFAAHGLDGLVETATACGYAAAADLALGGTVDVVDPEPGTLAGTIHEPRQDSPDEGARCQS